MNANNVLGLIFSESYSSCISELTTLRTMASVPFGGKYRFIDFTLSNMVNCGMTRVGIITKTNYQSLMDHVGNGKSWDLSRKNEGLFFLPPFNHGSGIYTGKIDALSSAMNFITMSDKDYVVLSDSNFICNIDLGDVIEKHIQSGADITVTAASGAIPRLRDIMLFDIAADGRIRDIAIPAAPEGEGVYSTNIIVIGRTLLERLVNEAVSYNYISLEHDILQKNVDSLYIQAYVINDFIAVIDSMPSYLEANLSLLDPDCRDSLFVRSRPVYTKIADDMPALYGIGSVVKNSIITDGSKIYGEVENSILFRDVQVAKGARVKNSIIMHHCVIGEDAVLENVIIDKDCVIRNGKKLCGASSYPVYVGKGIII